MQLDVHFSKFLNRIEAEDLHTFVQTLLHQPLDCSTYIWTMNLSHIREISANPTLFEFLESKSMIVADGWPIKRLVKVLQSREVNRIPGVDLVDTLLASGVRFCVIGSNRDQVMKTLTKRKFDSSELTFIYDEVLDFNSEIQTDEIIQLLLKHKPNFIFIALGFPKQEFFYEKLQSRCSLFPAYYLGVGGSFQLLSGEKVRAPRRFQDIGLEWLWRWVQDPKRLFSRYFADGKFLIQLGLQRKVKMVRDTLRKWIESS